MHLCISPVRAGALFDRAARRTLVGMRAAVTPTYGPANVLELRELATPTLGEGEVLVEVRASPVTAADHRLRAADFPSFSALIGRLIIGMRRPRHAVQGTMFAGRIVAVGPSVTRYAVGDDVFGSTDHGAYAEYLVAQEDGPMARKPAGLGYDEAAALPYGGVTALHFLRDLAAVRAGERVLVLGASGGVGRFAVQLAKHLGGEVTAVCSAANFELVRSLGADHVLDHATNELGHERYDVIFDVAGVTSFTRSRAQLTDTGRYLTLILSIGVLLQMLLTSMRRGRKAMFAIAFCNRRNIEEIRDLAERGVVRPVIARRFPLAQIADDHAARERGAVIVDIA
jgi:NADPH:quinone reductase-like Zn-dependent oxidoreductase